MCLTFLTVRELANYHPVAGSGVRKHSPMLLVERPTHAASVGDDLAALLQIAKAHHLLKPEGNRVRGSCCLSPLSQKAETGIGL